MVIGDKVRMLHSHGEGVVTRVDGDTATVMLSQGIEIPVPRRHLVVVATRQEAVQLEKAGASPNLTKESRNAGMLFLTEGLYLAGIPRSTSQLDFFLVNQSDYHHSVVAYRLARPVNQFHGQFMVNPGSSVAIPGGPFPKKDSNHLLGLAFQFLKFHPSRGNPVPSGEFRMEFSRIPWEKIRQRIPLLEQEGYLIQLDEQPGKADPEKIKESMLQKKSEPVIPSEKKPLSSFREIDLHIEKLLDSFSELSPSEILDVQVRYFEAAFDRAIAEGLEKLIVIHGSGNGILRSEVQRRLAGNRQIRHFRDAQKERFGYGATEIVF